MSENDKKRGGARPGSGRPRKNRTHTLSVRVSAETLEKLKAAGENLTDTIEKLAQSL